MVSQDFLPIITEDDLVIDASDAGVILDGSDFPTNWAIQIYGADNVKVKGLQIQHFQVGLTLSNGASHAVIGGHDPEDRNIISGNQDIGILLTGEGTSHNTVIGNYIGVGPSDHNSVGNGIGIQLQSGVTHTTIGDETGQSFNVISGNEKVNIQIIGNGTDNNRVIGNLVGTDSTGRVALGGVYGISIADLASHNTIGGLTDSHRNVISGNDDTGIVILLGAEYNTVVGNLIGTDRDGLTAVRNFKDGILIADAMRNTIGSKFVSGRNIIGGNGTTGIEIQGSASKENVVIGNYIGTDIRGTATLPNLQSGILIGRGAESSVIGGAELGEGNVVSGNRGAGIALQTDANSTRVLGNFIGTDNTGMVALPSQRHGLIIHESGGIVVGGVGESAGNVISGQLENGMVVQGASHNIGIEGNKIGTSSSGDVAIANGTYGILVTSGSSDNTIGGKHKAAANIIGRNGRSGVRLFEAGTGNEISGNVIGVNTRAGACIGNGINGVSVQGVDLTTIGPGNVISCNESDGVALVDDAFDPLRFRGSKITKNEIYGNQGLPITCIEVRGQSARHVDCAVPQPTLRNWSLSQRQMAGTACSNCMLEVFVGDGSGKASRFSIEYLVSEPSGDFLLPIDFDGHASYVSVVAVDSDGSTSKYSEELGIFVHRLFIPIGFRN